MRVAFIILIVLFIAGMAHAEIPDDVGVACVVGEAANQGLEGMIAVADAMQNRGSTRGVYGCKAAHVAMEPEWVWKMARRAWQAAKNGDFVGGADHWESVNFKRPDWSYSMVETIRVGKHIFYRKQK